jgi:hypothetical protein
MGWLAWGCARAAAADGISEFGRTHHGKIAVYIDGYFTCGEN